MSSNEDDENENDKILMSSNEDDENDKTLISSNVDDENENEDDDDETVKQKEKNIRIKNINDYLDEIIDKSKSFEDQIKSIRKLKNLDEYWHSDDYGDKALKFKYSKLKLAHMSNEIDKKLFEQIFGHTLENKLINTKKEENQIIVNNINKNQKKLHEIDKTDPYHDYVIQPSSRRVNLKLILNFNEII